MTVSSTQSRKDYAGDGATTQFTVPYFFIENADIVATLRSTGGTETTWTEGTEYTLTGAGVPSGGTLTAVSTGTDYTPQSGETLVIKRKEQFTQPSDFAVAGALPSETIEEGYDRGVMLAQQLSEDLGRAARLAETSPTTSGLIIPEPEADKALSWNSAGDNLTNGPTVAQITQASTKADQAAASATAAANSASAAANSANGLNAGGFKFTFDTSTTMADPGTGDIRFNNATVASVTALALDALSADNGNPDVSDFIATWDDSTNTALRGTLALRKVGTPGTFAVFNVTGAVTDNTGWLQVTVTHVVSAGTFSAADEVLVYFTRTGNAPGGSVNANFAVIHTSDTALASKAAGGSQMGSTITNAAIPTSGVIRVSLLAAEFDETLGGTDGEITLALDVGGTKVWAVSDEQGGVSTDMGFQIDVSTTSRLIQTGADGRAKLVRPLLYSFDIVAGGFPTGTRDIQVYLGDRSGGTTGEVTVTGTTVPCRLLVEVIDTS